MKGHHFNLKVASSKLTSKVYFRQYRNQSRRFIKYSRKNITEGQKINQYVHLLSLEKEPDPRSPITPGCLGPVTFLFNWRKGKKSIQIDLVQVDIHSSIEDVKSQAWFSALDVFTQQQYEIKFKTYCVSQKNTGKRKRLVLIGRYTNSKSKSNGSEHQVIKMLHQLTFENVVARSSMSDNEPTTDPWK